MNSFFFFNFIFEEKGVEEGYVMRSLGDTNSNDN